MKKKIILSLCGLIVFWQFIEWTVNYYYVPEGNSLMLRYKGPLLFGSKKTCVQGYWANEGEIGVLEKLRGPGRHFYCPIWWERDLVSDIIIKTGSVGIVTCKLGKSLPEGEFLVDGELGETQSKGVLRKVLGPGRYRINPYGYDVQIINTEIVDSGNTKKHSGWIIIPTGFVGVVTNQTDNPITKQKTGIQDKVLQPGIYPINPKEQQIDIVEIGFRETTVCIKGKNREEPDSETVEGGISFPSSDGFKITMDFTSIWGLYPDQAPNAIRKFGNIDSVEEKVVKPQIESICRNNGSEYSAVSLLVGKEREEFQQNTLVEFRNVLKDKHITLRDGLVRHIYIPKVVREPIQTAFIADELKLTREQEQKTVKVEADLRESERKVEFETVKVKSETTKLFSERIANGDKEVAEIEADTRKFIAAIQKHTSQLESDAYLIRGQASSDGKKMMEEAKSSKFKLAVEAFGNSNAYNSWVFASNLPDKIDLKMLYAGTGTLWTDLKDALKVVIPAK